MRTPTTVTATNYREDDAVIVSESRPLHDPRNPEELDWVNKEKNIARHGQFATKVVIYEENFDNIRKIEISADAIKKLYAEIQTIELSPVIEREVDVDEDLPF